mmetsp:Transcript_81588/g.251846  ORF Transcript_81588/g.251846 Transcript_81588/m.251846 type:complete len:268 (+) Transcript_81588:524-1327(+)
MPCGGLPATRTSSCRVVRMPPSRPGTCPSSGGLTSICGSWRTPSPTPPTVVMRVQCSRSLGTPRRASSSAPDGMPPLELGACWRPWTMTCTSRRCRARHGCPTPAFAASRVMRTPSGPSAAARGPACSPALLPMAPSASGARQQRPRTPEPPGKRNPLLNFASSPCQRPRHPASLLGRRVGATCLRLWLGFRGRARCCLQASCPRCVRFSTWSEGASCAPWPQRRLPAPDLPVRPRPWHAIRRWTSPWRGTRTAGRRSSARPRGRPR